jgi:hypothetical protein
MTTVNKTSPFKCTASFRGSNRDKLFCFFKLWSLAQPTRKTKIVIGLMTGGILLKDITVNLGLNLNCMTVQISEDDCEKKFWPV